MIESADQGSCSTFSRDLGFLHRYKIRLPLPHRDHTVAAAIHAKFPGKLLAYNCSPSFNWAAKLNAASMKKWREDLAALGYKFQFITLAGWHALNLSMFELASAYSADGMLGYSQLQEREFGQEAAGYRAVKHQAFVGTGYFDAVQTAISAKSSTVAMAGSTETEQFSTPAAAERVVA